MTKKLRKRRRKMMLLNNDNTNIPQVDVNVVKNIMTTLYLNAINKGVSLSTIPTTMLWGPPGVGKSSAVTQFCKELEIKSGKKVTLTDIRLLLFSPVDLRGVPVADVTHNFTQWLMPQIFDLSVTDDTVNIVFLDEISAAPQSVQAAAYQICLDHRIGEHKLPDNAIVIAAGNRTTDHSVAYKMPAALANRMLHFNVGISFDAWKMWAVNNGIDERILGYLSFDNSRLCEKPDNNSLAYPTPRSWEFVSTILKTTEMSVNEAHDYISSAVGIDTSLAFENWCNIFKKLPDTRDIFKGICKVKPNTHDALYAIISSMTTYVAEHKDVISVNELDNAFVYSQKFPTDFVMMFYDNLSYIDGISLKLLKCPSVKAWVNRRM